MTYMYVFLQNKIMAESVKNGIMVGKAGYIATGRPMANQHQTLRDLYVMYCKAHYCPAFDLGFLYVVYTLLNEDANEGQLPMVLIVISFMCWISSPLWFSPYPKLSLMLQDMEDFVAFILGKSGQLESEIDDVRTRGAHSEFRNVFEMGLFQLMNWYSERTVSQEITALVFHIAVEIYIMTILPASMLDFLFVFAAFTPAKWLLLVCYVYFDRNNVLLFWNLL